MNHYELSREITAFLREVELNGGELTPETLAELERLSGSRDAYLNNLSLLLAESIRQQQAAAEASALLRNRSKYHADRQLKIKQTMQDLLGVLDLRECDTHLYRLSIRRSPPSIAVDPTKLTVENAPERFLRVTKEINLQALAECIRRREEVPDGVSQTTREYLHVGLR